MNNSIGNGKIISNCLMKTIFQVNIQFFMKYRRKTENKINHY
jgi:hypothetical protein